MPARRIIPTNQLEGSVLAEDLGVLWDAKLNISPLCVPLQKRKSTTSWAALGRALPTGQGNWFFLCTQHQWNRSGVQSWAPWDTRVVDILEQVQLKATMMVKGLEYLIYQERLRELGMFSLEKKKLRRISSAYVNMIGWSKGHTAESCQYQGTGKQHKLKYRKFHLNIKSPPFLLGG